MAGFCSYFGVVYRRAFLGLIVLGAGLLACAKGSRSKMDSHVLRDSAGIQIAESTTPIWSDADAWTVELVASVRIGGEAEDSVPLVGVVRARVMANGRIVVATRGGDEVLMFDSLGNFERAIGGLGEGPGEFSRVDDLYKCAGDTLVVNDFTRMSFFDAQGQFVRTTRIRRTGEGGRRWIRGITANCTTWLVQTYSQEVPRHGTVGIEYTTLMWSPLDESSSDTIATIPSRKVYNRIFPGWDNLLVRVPWGQLSSRTLGGTRAYVGISDRPEVRVFETSGRLVQIIRWAESAVPVSRSDRRLFAEKRERWLPEVPQVRETVPPLREFPEIPNNKPLFSNLLTDDEGNLWVRGYPEFVAGRPTLYDMGGRLWDGESVGDAIEAWKVFDSAGRLLGVVHIPARLHVLAIERGYVITLSRGEYGVEAVELHRLDKGTEL